MPLPSVEQAQAKVATDGWLPVVLVATADGFTAVTGVTVATGYWATAGATAWNTYTIATVDWHEVGQGRYALNIGAGEFAAEGRYAVRVVAASGRPVEIDVEVLERTPQEMYSDVLDIRQSHAGVRVDDDNTNRRVVYELDGVTARYSLQLAYGAPTLTVTPI